MNMDGDAEKQGKMLDGRMKEEQKDKDLGKKEKEGREEGGGKRSRKRGK